MTHIHIIGCGRMGQAMVTRWLSHAEDTDITVVKPTPFTGALSQATLTYYENMSMVDANSADMVMLGVKPQIMPSIMEEVRDTYGTKPLFLTIAAGLSLSFYEEHLNEGARIVRLMPNTPVAIGVGVTSLVASGNVGEAEKQAVTALTNVLGTSCWLNSEEKLDAATAIAGSGPAYAYLFMDALTQAGVKHGLDAQDARALSVGMIRGAAHMADASDMTLTQLREQVTSKGGTTQAALNVFMDDDALSALTHDAINAAVARAKELNS